MEVHMDSLNQLQKYKKYVSTKVLIPQSFFEIQTPNFAWKFIWTVQPNEKVQKYKKYKSKRVKKYKSTEVQKYKSTKTQKYKNQKMKISKRSTKLCELKVWTPLIALVF